MSHKHVSPESSSRSAHCTLLLRLGRLPTSLTYPLQPQIWTFVSCLTVYIRFNMGETHTGVVWTRRVQTWGVVMLAVASIASFTAVELNGDAVSSDPCLIEYDASLRIFRLVSYSVYILISAVRRVPTLTPRLP